jgi:dsRNA-specific ribonuclease
LSEKDPINLDFEIVKLEVQRLSFIGDQVINLACVMNLIFSRKTEWKEKELDIEKNKIINKDNLKKVAEGFGLRYIRINTKNFKIKPSSSQKKLENEI